MKYYIFILASLLIFSCAKKEIAQGQYENEKLQKLSLELENSKFSSEEITASSNTTIEPSSQKSENATGFSAQNHQTQSLNTALKTASVKEQKQEIKKEIRALKHAKKTIKDVDKNVLFALALLLIGLLVLTLGVIFLYSSGSTFFYLVVGLSISLIYAGISTLLRALIFGNHQ